MQNYRKQSKALAPVNTGAGQMSIHDTDRFVEDMGFWERARARRRVARVRDQHLSDELVYVEERRVALRRTRIDNLSEQALAMEGKAHREIMDELRREELDGVADARLKLSATILEVGQKIVRFHDESKEIVESATSDFGRDYLKALQQQELEANIRLNEWQSDEADSAHRNSAGRHVLSQDK